MCESSVTLAECPGLGRVRLCNCGCVQLNLGPVTIRLEPAALSQAAAMLQAALENQERLQSKSQSDSIAPEWLSPGTLVN